MKTNKMSNKDEWNQTYSQKGSRHKNNYPSDLVVGWVLRNYRNTGSKYLDLGCGYGSNLRFLLN